MIIDLNRLLQLEKITITNDSCISLDSNLQSSLGTETWNQINRLYSTLEKNKDTISGTLNKFINKNKKNSHSEFTFIDTFSGCGGLSLGLMSSGFNPVLVNEIEPKFLETYYFNHDLHIDNYHCGDIKDIAQKTNFERNIDLVVGGVHLAKGSPWQIDKDY